MQPGSLIQCRGRRRLSGCGRGSAGLVITPVIMMSGSSRSQLGKCRGFYGDEPCRANSFVEEGCQGFSRDETHRASSVSGQGCCGFSLAELPQASSEGKEGHCGFSCTESH